MYPSEENLLQTFTFALCYIKRCINRRECFKSLNVYIILMYKEIFIKSRRDNVEMTNKGRRAAKGFATF